MPAKVLSRAEDRDWIALKALGSRPSGSNLWCALGFGPQTGLA